MRECLASCLVSLYITLYRPFIASQRDRTDVIIRVNPPAPLLHDQSSLTRSLIQA